LHLVLLERQVRVEVKTKAETFWQLLVELVARRVRLATRVPAAIQPREATEHRAQPWARLVLAVEVGLAAVNLRLMGMALRRLTAARVVALARLVRLVLRVAWLPMVAVVPAAVVAAVAASLLGEQLAGRAVPVAQDLMDT
jgi:hypothetical protein